MKCSIIKRDGWYLIDVDGRIIYPSAYMSYYPEEKNIELFKSYGIRLFMFPVYAGDQGINMETGLRPFCGNFFKGYGEYDFSEVERMLRMVDPTGCGDVYVIPRVCLEPPKWWMDLHPEELARDHRGEALRECFASDVWRKDMAVALKALIDFIGQSIWKNQVIGYHIAAGGTEEWTYHARYANQYYDYSKRNLDAFRTYIKCKYQTVEALASAWKQDISASEEISFPAPVERTYAKKGFVRDPEAERPVLDYFDFHNETVANTITFFCRQVKKYTNYERLTGAFYGYVFSMPHNHKGLHAMGKLLKSPYIDFISTTNEGKEPGEAWAFSSAVHSALLHGKMWMCEGDLRTCMTTGLQEKLPFSAPDNDIYSSRVWVGPPTMELSCSVLTKGLARTLTTPCGIWWFDMFGGWFSHPAMMRIIGRTSMLLEQQLRDYLRTEIAVLIDEKGHKYCGLKDTTIRDGIRELIQTLSHMGAPHHNYLLSDLLEDSFPADEYKLFIMVTATEPSEEEAAVINRKLKRDGKVILWLHTSSCYNPALCEFKLVPQYDGMSEKAVYEGRFYPHLDLPIWKFAEEEGYVLARLEKSREPAVIWKQRKNYSTVYSLHLAPSSELLRQIALLSGVHLYSLSGDCVYAHGEFVGIHAIEAGYRRINLPERDFTATNALTGEPVTVNDMFVDLKLEQYETVILHIEKS